MSENRKYATDATFYFPLITEAAPDFIIAAVPSAGDAKLWTTAQIAANPTSFILGFDSMSELPTVGDQIDENGAGTAQAVVMDTIITSGTIGGGDAAGFMFVKSVSGQAWSNDDQIDINGGTANIATADSTTHDLAATAGLIGVVGGGQYAVGLTAAEMTCIQGTITIIDAAGDAYEDQAIAFTTYGNASALHAMDFDDAVRGGMTALPSAAADAAGGLVISDAGGFDIDAKLSDARVAVLTDWVNGGRLDLILDIIAADVVNIDGAAMRGTDSAALASEVTAARMSELDAGTAGKMANQVDEIRTDTGEIGTAGAGLTDITINSASVDAVWAKAMTELASTPGVTGTVLQALEWVFLLSRNKGTQTSTTKTLRNNADNADIATSAVSDDATTFIRGKYS